MFKLLIKNGARIQEPTCVTKVALFIEKFSTEIVSVSEKLKNGDPIDETELDALDFIQAEAIAKRRKKAIYVALDQSVIPPLSQIINEYDEGESYKDAYRIRELV